MSDSGNAPEEREEKKPVTSEHVNLKVVGADNNEVFFKIKRQTALKKLMETYCERQGKSMATVRFLIDGDRIHPTQSPEDLDLQDGDTIEVMIRKASYTSNAASATDRTSIDIDRTINGLQAARVSSTGRRTMSLDEDDEDDFDATNPWEQLQATSGPMTSVSETGSQAEDINTVEVKILCVTNLSRNCTSRDIYSAFDMNKDDMTIELQSHDSALLHFADSETAMKAYYSYLKSTNSIGTVNPYEPGISDALVASPAKQDMPPLRNRRSFQNTNGNVLSALTNISSWRSSDKLSTGKDLQNDREFRPGHRTNSSRSSIYSKSTERLPSLTAPSKSSTPLASNHTSPAIDQKSFSDADSQNSARRTPPVTTTTATTEKRSKQPSAARRIMSAAGMTLKLPKRDKSEKETKTQPQKKQSV